jgi:hypothetical protein
MQFTIAFSRDFVAKLENFGVQEPNKKALKLQSIWYADFVTQIQFAVSHSYLLKPTIARLNAHSKRIDMSWLPCSFNCRDCGCKYKKTLDK